MTVYEDDLGDYRCWNCDFMLVKDWNYCPCCGQKIDWSEVNDEVAG